MPINPSIALQVRQPEIESPLNALAQASQVKNAMNQNRLFDMQVSENERKQARQNALMQATRNSFDPETNMIVPDKYRGALAEMGDYEGLQSFEKSQQEQIKAKGAADKQQVELIDAKLKQSREFLEGVSTPEQYIMWHEANHKDPVLGPALAARGVTAETARASIMKAIQEPGGLEKLLNQSRLGIEKFTEQNKPKIETRNLGGTTETMAIDPFTGQVKVTNSVKNTQSPDNAASVGASYANAAATRSVAAATRDAAAIQRDQATEMKLGDDYRAQSKDFKAASDAYRQINSTLDKATTSPAATLAAATKFMKLLDPGSVVRESELGMALAATGAFDRATNYFNTLQKGKVLTPNQVADFKNITQQIYGAAQAGQKAVDSNYKRQAEAYKLRPEMIIQDLGQDVAPKGSPSAPVAKVPANVQSLLDKYK